MIYLKIKKLKILIFSSSSSQLSKILYVTNAIIKQIIIVTEICSKMDKFCIEFKNKLKSICIKKNIFKIKIKKLTVIFY